MKAIDEKEVYQMVVSFLLIVIAALMILFIVINYMVFQEIKKGNELLIAGQNQIAGFMMVPGPKQTGPITIMYGEVEPKQDPGKPHKKVNEKAQPKKGKK